MHPFILYVLIFMTLPVFLVAQPSDSCHLVAEECVQRFHELKSEFGRRKEIPSELELPCLVALSYYPELKDVPIRFKYSSGSYTMAARPQPLSFWRSRRNRRNTVFINQSSRCKALLVHQISFNAQVGVIGHELAHIAYYRNRSMLSLIWSGLAYRSREYKKKFERDTDLRTYQHGLGCQLYRFAMEALSNQEATESYRKDKQEIYLTPAEISSLLGCIPD